MDWGLGSYERTAAQLLPAARVLVERAALSPGERVLDVGCGSGNTALLAAERGCVVTGVDPAARLLEVARADAAARGLDATFLEGRAEALPVGDAAFDVALSSFAVIFAENPAAAAAELARVVAAGGRLALTAWIPGGGISDSIRIFREAVDDALGREPAPPGLAWHERDALAALLEPHGFSGVRVAEERLAFTAASAQAHLEDDARHHPLSVAGRAVLERAGTAEATSARALAVLEAANEDPSGFRVTSRYVVATATRA